jgi:hypothetical protein
MPLGRGVYKKHKCTQRGCTEKFRTIVARGVHLAKSHGIKGAWAEAMAESRRKGLFHNPGNPNGRRKLPNKVTVSSKWEQDREAEVDHLIEEARKNEQTNGVSRFDAIEERLQQPEPEKPKSNGHGISALESLTWYAFGHIQAWLSQCAAGNGVSEAALAANVAELLHAQSSREGFLGPQHDLSQLRENSAGRIEG